MQNGAMCYLYDVTGFLLAQKNLALSEHKEDQVLYSQGEPVDSVFYVHSGKVKVTVISKFGKEAVVGIRGPDVFCGEGALTGKPLRLTTVTTMSTCEIIRLQTATVMRLLHENLEFADYFISKLLTRTARVEADLVDQLLSSSEMRLARALLLLSSYGSESGPSPIPAAVTQDTLAALIGTTRPRINFFMNKFRKLGFIQYNGVIQIDNSLLSVVLHE